jgi:class 3 adenylate cyclase
MKRKIAAILAADIAGYSKLVAEDEEETLRRLESYRLVFDDFIKRHDGRIFNTAGDAVLAEFPSAVEAMRCAIDVQESLRTRNLAYPESRHMQFRIGVTIGDVVERETDLLGDAVNIAARLESLAQPGGICVSRIVYEQVANKLSVQFADIGEQLVKNIPTPVHAFTVSLRGEAGHAPTRGVLSGMIRAMPWALAIIVGLGAAYALFVTLQARTAAPVAEKPAPVQRATSAAKKSTAVAAQLIPLVPDQIPLVSAAARKIIQNDYLSAKNHKALAISAVRFGIASGLDNEDAAKVAALAACRSATDAIRRPELPCDLYAVGDRVVSVRGHPPMPAEPWLVRAASIETPFQIDQVPLMIKDGIEKSLGRYRDGKHSRALALSSSGLHSFYTDQPTLGEAVRRALEYCGYRAGVACRIVAVDDVFVVPLPTGMKAVGFFQAHANAMIAPELRDDVVRRLANSQNGWSSVATGSAGQTGIAIGAASEQAAGETALAECARRDRGCRVIALGPFAVEPK